MRGGIVVKGGDSVVSKKCGGGDSNVYVRAIASYQRGLHVHVDVFHREGS